MWICCHCYIYWANLSTENQFSRKEHQKSGNFFFICLRVGVLLRTDSGYLKDTGVTLFTLATYENPLRYNAPMSALLVSALAHSISIFCVCDNRSEPPWGMPHVHESYCTYEWVMAHIWMSPVARMNASRHTFEWGVDVTHIDPWWVLPLARESCHTYEYVWVMPHVWMRHIKHIEPFMSHVTHMNVAR